MNWKVFFAVIALFACLVAWIGFTDLVVSHYGHKVGFVFWMTPFVAGVATVFGLAAKK